MSLTINIGGSFTGGTPTVLTSVGGSQPGQSLLQFPTSSRLTPRQLKLISNTPVTNRSNPGTVRTSARFILGNRVESEGCCTVTAGTVIGEINVTWPLSQPDTLIDDLVDMMRAYVMTSAFVDQIKRGTLPA